MPPSRAARNTRHLELRGNPIGNRGRWTRVAGAGCVGGHGRRCCLAAQRHSAAAPHRASRSAAHRLSALKPHVAQPGCTADRSSYMHLGRLQRRLAVEARETMSAKAWGGRFTQELSRVAARMNASVDVDKRLAAHDITASVVQEHPSHQVRQRRAELAKPPPPRPGELRHQGPPRRRPGGGAVAAETPRSPRRRSA